MSATLTDPATGKRVEAIIPPEGVPVMFDIAGLGTRFGAQLLDVIITFGGIFLFVLALLYTGGVSSSAMIALFYLLSFFVRIPYYIFSELVWNGQTLGKRMTRIRVISANGRRLTPHQIVARNLLKEVEIFTPVTMMLGATNLPEVMIVVLCVWLLIIFTVPLISKKRQRIGDMVAGTIVVDQPKIALLPDLAQSAAKHKHGFVFNSEHLEIYGRYELQTLEAILREPPKTPEAVNRAHDVARTIMRKIGYAEKVGSNEEWQFLTDFYRQQREYLETRKLFGDARENKFHADKRDEPKP